ncbi:hypothetical protein DVH24_041666 [Malus domestica]|uniref:Protein kinase domain-containing protein n=1 Tax=Malus domestica TaxID=3750 RepID=A0A498IMX2_MALDO|nr:hypothetical protein DVH24_041666 [Malus domestica]
MQGDLKRVLSPETGLEPKEQRLLFRGKEKEDNECLHIAGVKDMSKIVLLEDPASKEKKLEEMKKNQGVLNAYEEVAKVRAEIVDLETSLLSGTKVSDKDIVVLTELLMVELLKLDSIVADGEAKVQRRVEVRRVQSFVDTLDNLKARNSSPFSKKRYIDDNATHVAIKRLRHESSQRAREFKTEIELLSQLRHAIWFHSLVTSDNGEMILVYDDMARGTLGDHRYRTGNPKPLPLKQRLEICIGATRGLHYLHNDAEGSIIHRDVKSTNILLDEETVAKVSNFGLSKMGTTSTSKTHISTVVKGSFGYLDPDPEYYRHQQLSKKSDVYSFGVVLWKVLCARPALMRTVEPRQISFAEWVKSCHGDGTLGQIIDPNVKGKIEVECLNKFIEIAISCLNDKGIERSSMNDVRGLELVLQLHQESIGSEGDDAVAFINDRRQ